MTLTKIQFKITFALERNAPPLVIPCDYDAFTTRPDKLAECRELGRWTADQIRQEDEDTMAALAILFGFWFDWLSLPRGLSATQKGAVSTVARAIPEGQTVTARSSNGSTAKVRKSGNSLDVEVNGKRGKIDVPEGSLVDNVPCVSLGNLRQVLAQQRQGIKIASLSLTAEMLQPQNASFLKDDDSFELAALQCGFFKTNAEAKIAAENLGYTKTKQVPRELKSHGADVYYNKSAKSEVKYISPSNTNHSGEAWKGFDAKGMRTGGYDVNLNFVAE